MNRAPGPGTAPPELPGYRFIKPIGAGGNARVYLYEQDLPHRRVAVKVLNESALSEAARRRFTAEANVTAGLEHRHIVRVFDAKVTDDGRPYLVMPYYPQPNLWLRARRAHFAVAEVLRVGIQVGSAVETSHRAGVLHRDIKPQNILTDAYGEPALTDFGIATRAGVGPEGLSVPWAPPEILFGTGPGDQRSDVYSLGATLWYLLAGWSPFEDPGGDNETPALMRRIQSASPPGTQRGDVPESLEQLLRHTLAKDPAARPQTALELIHGLQAVEQELRLPLTQAVLSADQPPADAFDGAPRPPGTAPGGETTQRRVVSGPPAQPAWGGGYVTTVTRSPQPGGTWPPPPGGDHPAQGTARPGPGPAYPGVPAYPGGPGHRAGRRGNGSSQRMLTLVAGVALLAAVAVVAVLIVNPGRNQTALESSGNIEVTTQAAGSASAGGPVPSGPVPATPTAAAAGNPGAVSPQSPQPAPDSPAVGTSSHPSVHTSSSSPVGHTLTPAAPIGTPTVTATANGAKIDYTWSAPSDGLTEALKVCIAGACSSYTVPATGGYRGSSSASYGYSQTETITAQLTDTAGRSGGTATASATTAAAPVVVTTSAAPPANPTVSVSVGGVMKATTGCVNQTCYGFNVSVSNFPADTTLSYSCAGNGSVWYGPTSTIYNGSSVTGPSGSTTFVPDCIHTLDGTTVTITVSGGGKSASGNVTA